MDIMTLAAGWKMERMATPPSPRWLTRASALPDAPGWRQRRTDGERE